MIRSDVTKGLFSIKDNICCICGGALRALTSLVIPAFVTTDQI